MLDKHIHIMEDNLGAETVEEIRNFLRTMNIPEHDAIYIYTLIYKNLSKDIQNSINSQKQIFNNFLEDIEERQKKLANQVEETIFEKIEVVETAADRLQEYATTIETMLQENMETIQQIPENAGNKIIETLDKIEYKLEKAEQIAKLEVEKNWHEGMKYLAEIGGQKAIRAVQNRILYLGITSIALTIIGFALGWVLGHSRYDGRGYVRMTTEEQAQFLWANSREGRRAKELWEWNRDNIDSCQTEQNQTGGACYLWVVPREQRKRN